MRRLLHLLLALTLALSLGTAALADGAGDQRVYDQAGLFSPGEVQRLEERLAEAGAQLKADLVVATTDDAQGKATRLYAADFYDQGGFGVGRDYSGVILLIDMENREAAVVSTGKMIDLLTDQRIESILDDVFDALGDGDYAQAAHNYVDAVLRWSAQGVPEDGHRYDTETGKITYPKRLRPTEVVIAALLAAAAGAAACWGVARSYRQEGPAQPPYNFRSQAVSNLTAKGDRFLHQTVTTRHIPRTPPPSSGGGSGGGGSSSGRSSTFSGSSGRSHGGGSRKF